MERKIVLGTALMLVLTSMMMLAFNIQPGRADLVADNPLVTSYTLIGNLKVIVVAVPFNCSTDPSGTFVVSGIPSGSTVVEALVYHQEWEYSPPPNETGFPSSTLAGYNLGSIPPLTHDPGGTLDLAVYRWDVTGIVTGNGTYPFTTARLERVFGAALVIVYSNPANPSVEVRINDGAESMCNTTATTTFSGVVRGRGKLIIFTEADDPGETGETIEFNSVVVGGPIDANLGPFASLFTLPVATVFGTNNASITTLNDLFGWHLAILISPRYWYPLADINGDGTVDIEDIVTCALAFGSKPGYSNWNPVADLNQDGLIDIFDIVTVAINFGKKYP